MELTASQLILEQQRLKNELEAEEKAKLEAQQPKLLKCSCCGNKIEAEDEYFYKCRLHKNIFCKNCNERKGEINILEGKFAKCREQLFDRKDCIFERREIGKP